VDLYYIKLKTSLLRRGDVFDLFGLFLIFEKIIFNTFTLKYAVNAICFYFKILNMFFFDKNIYLYTVSVLLLFFSCRSSSVSIVEKNAESSKETIEREPGYLIVDKKYNCPSNESNPYTTHHLAFLSDTINETFNEQNGNVRRWKDRKFINYPINRFVKSCGGNVLIALSDQEAKDLHSWLLSNQCKKTESLSTDMSIDNGNTCIIFPDSLCIIVLEK
jgi:hypothetical protein